MAVKAVLSYHSACHPKPWRRMELINCRKEERDEKSKFQSSHKNELSAITSRKGENKMKDEEIARLLGAWAIAFWRFRENVGIGDSFQIESERLKKNLAKLRTDLTFDNPTTPRKIYCFLKGHGGLTPEIKGIIARFEREIGVRYLDSEDINYSEYLEY